MPNRPALQRRALLLALSSPPIFAFSAPAPAAAVPPPVEQSVANCDHPQYATDRLVCETPALLDLDRQMRELLVAQAIPNDVPGIEPQQQWLKRRSMCAFDEDHAACTHDAYIDRIAILRSYGAPAPSDRVALRCDVPAVVAMASGEQAHAFYAGDGRMVVYARSKAPRASSWKDYAQLTSNGPKIRVDYLDGRVMRCRVQS